MQFDFGKNWLEFSEKALTEEKINQARRDFGDLMDRIDLHGKSFLDIGFGQGLSLIVATENGAKAVGNDVNAKCADVLYFNALNFSEIRISDLPIVIGSILDSAVVDELKKKAPNGGYEIVHSWGVLHHTGDMKSAINNATSLVKNGGYLVLALYNRHWTSPLWKGIKWFYCCSSNSIQKVTVGVLYPVIWMAKFIVAGYPKKKSRGMDFYYDVIDWIGGYPYEYASSREVKNMLDGLDFKCIEEIPAQVPTGCNEFVFVKRCKHQEKRKQNEHNPQ